MTTLYLANIADAISSVSISGVTVKDKDQVAGSWVSTPKVLYPNPENWIENTVPTYDITGNLETLSYRLNYRYLSVLVGGIETAPQSISNLVDEISLIIGALVDSINPYSANVEMKVAGVSMGFREDPSGSVFHGADVQIDIVETH